MTEGHTPSSGQAYRTVTLTIGEDTYNRLVAATHVSGAVSPQSLVATSLMKYLEQIEMAHDGTVLRKVDTTTCESSRYEPPELYNAFEYGRHERENPHGNTPRETPAGPPFLVVVK